MYRTLEIGWSVPSMTVLSVLILKEFSPFNLRFPGVFLPGRKLNLLRKPPQMTKGKNGFLRFGRQKKAISRRWPRALHSLNNFSTVRAGSVEGLRVFDHCDWYLKAYSLDNNYALAVCGQKPQSCETVRVISPDAIIRYFLDGHGKQMSMSIRAAGRYKRLRRSYDGACLLSSSLCFIISLQ